MTEIPSESIPAETDPGAAGPMPKLVKAKNEKVGLKKRATPTSKRPPKDKSVRSASQTEPSDDAIRVRAYFIAENRLRAGSGGDPANDWVEARAQLREQARTKER